MKPLRRYSGALLAALGIAVFAALVPKIGTLPRASVSAEMQVALPRFIQVLMAGGDRYLAANIAGFRALLVSTENMGPENYRIQGVVQSDAAWLNPAHEDNYYIAAAILPWNGEVAASQYVLHQAALARPFDWQPPFYYAFNLMHFLKDPAAGAEWLMRAGRAASDDLMQIQLQQVAALWVTKGDDPQFAIRMHRVMAREVKNSSFAKFLEKRAVRLENLYVIDQAVGIFKKTYGKSPRNIAELREAGLLSKLPEDPFGIPYELDAHGKAQAINRNPVPQGNP